MEDYRWLRQLYEAKRNMGIPVVRATALPATGNLFQVIGGKAWITSLVGEITVGMDANATSSLIRAVPTVGTTTNLCLATDIASYAIGDLVGISGVPTDALLPAISGSAIPGMTFPVIVKTGFINLLVAVAGQVLGRIAWTINYVPLDPSVSIAAV